MEEALARAFMEQGLLNVFGVTGGGSSWRLISALERAGACYYPASHEASAAIMAGAARRASGRPAAAIGIKGPGLANMLPGIAFNHFENVPMVSVCEAYAPSVPRFRMHKRLDHGAMLRPICKGSVSMANAPRRLPALLKLAVAEIPGPVHIDLCEGEAVSVPWHATAADPDDQGLGARAFEAVTSRIAQSSRPLLVVGSVAMRRDWGAFLGNVNVPILTTAAAKGAIDEQAPNALGVYTGDGGPVAPENDALRSCDLVIGLGLRNVEVLSPRSFERPTLLLDSSCAGHASGFGEDTACVALSDARIADILGMLRDRAWGAELVSRLRRRVDEVLRADEWLPAACFHALNALEYDHWLVLDTGSFCTVGEHVWRAGPGRRFFGSSNGRYMGGAIPTAIGAAAAMTGVPIFCATGDGGVRMYTADIALAVKHRLAVCFMLMSDGRYGSIACAPGALGLSGGAIDMSGHGWAASAEAIGCEAHVVGDVGKLEHAVSGWRRLGPLFLECRFPPAPYAAMTKDLR